MPSQKLKPIQSKTNHYCFRCQIKLGKILNRGSWCPICRRKICKKCLASSNLNSSFCQSKFLHQKFINYQLINQKQLIDTQYKLKFSTNSILNNVSNNDHKLINENIYLNNNLPEYNQINKNLSKSNPTLNENTQLNQFNDTIDNNQQVPKKIKRKNTGIYIKRATSSATADTSLIARKYKANLNRTQNQESKCFTNNTKQLSKSCTELTQQEQTRTDYFTNKCSSQRCTSEQNLNLKNEKSIDNDNQFDKSASLPKFNLNRLLSKLKRSHTIANVDDIGKRRSILNTGYKQRSQTLKNQYDNYQKSSTIWRRSSALAAQGHQLYLKTLNLGSLFKRQQTNNIPICKLKGICTFCCKKITNENVSYNQTIEYSLNHQLSIQQLNDQQSLNEIANQLNQNDTQINQAPKPPIRKSNLVKSNSQKDNSSKSPRIPIKPERKFIVQRCVLEQSCSLGELNIKQLGEQNSDQDSGLQRTNSLEGLDQKSNPRKIQSSKSTTLPKTMLFGLPFTNEKRSTLRVRSKILMNEEDGTFYVQDSDWEMCSESDNWQKSDQFSSISSTELNELSCEYFKLNSNLCKDKLLNDITVDNKSDTLCNRNSKLNDVKDDNKEKNENNLNNNSNENNDKKKIYDKFIIEEKLEHKKEQKLKTKIDNNFKQLNEHQFNEKLNKSFSKNDQDENKEKQSNDELIMKLDYDEKTTTIKEKRFKKNENQLEFNNENDKFRKSTIKTRANSIGDNINDEFKFSNLNKEIKLSKNIKRSASETVLHFNNFDYNNLDDVHSADDELDDDDSLNDNSKNKKLINSSSKRSSNLSLNNHSYCLDIYSIKNETKKIPDQALDLFSSDEQSIEQNQLIEQNILNELPINKSPMLDLETTDQTEDDDINQFDTSNSKKREFDLNELIDEMEKNQLEHCRKQREKKLADSSSTFNQSNDNSIEQDLIESSQLSSKLNENYYNLYQNDDSSLKENESTKLNESEDFENQEEEEFLNNIQSSTEFDNELFNHEQFVQPRHHITSLENLFSLETIQEQDEEDYSLKDQSSLKSNLIDQVSNNNESTSKIETTDEYLDNKSSNNTNKLQLSESTENQINLTKKSQNTEEIVNNIYKKVCFKDDDDDELDNDITISSVIEDESVSTDYKKFKTFKRDSSIYDDDEEITISNDSKSKLNDNTLNDGEENFNSLSECTIDENVTIVDHQFIINKDDKLNKNKSKSLNYSNKNQTKPLIRPEICKRSSLINKNIEQLDKSKKKINDLLQSNKIEPRSRISNLIPNRQNSTFKSISLINSSLDKKARSDLLNNKLNLAKKELSESGVHMDQIDNNQQNIKNNLNENEKLNQIKNRSSHLQIDNSSGVDSGPSSEDNIENNKISNNSSKLTKSNDLKSNEPLEPIEKMNQNKSNNLLKSKSMYNVDQQQHNQKINYLSSIDHRLSSEEFNRRRRSYEVNLDYLENEYSTTNKNDTLNNLRRKSTNYLLNQSFNQLQLSQDDVTKIKKELIRRSEERLARFETSISSRSNSRHNSIIESVSYNQNNNNGNNSKNEKSLSNKNHSSDEDDYQNRRISRKDIGDKWRETLKRNDSLDSINSIKSMNSLESMTSDNLANLKCISRNRIKSTSFLETNQINSNNDVFLNDDDGQLLSEDEYDYSTDNHYVYKDRITGEYLTESNLIHFRSNKVKNGNKKTAIYDEQSNVEEDNDYDELIENSYVEISDKSINNHTYKMISEHNQNPYELMESGIDENPYFSIKEIENNLNYQNLNELQLIEKLDNEEDIDLEDYHRLKYSSPIKRRETFNQSNLSQVKLPLKRSKSVPGNNTFNSKYLNGRSSLSKSINKKDNRFLLNQLEFQKEHLHKLHKQHWRYRLKNENDESNEYTSLFSLNRDEINRTPELLIAYEYRKHDKQVHLFIKECRNFTNLFDKYLKIYLLPDKNKKKEELQSKTIGHVNNLIERKSFEICSPIINKKFVFDCVEFDKLTKSRTIFISVFKAKKSLLEKQLCLGELFLTVKDEDDNLKTTNLNKINEKIDKLIDKIDEITETNSSDIDQNKLNIKFNLKEEENSKLTYKWYNLDQSFNYSGEIIFSTYYDSIKKQLKIKVIGCSNLLTRKRNVGSSNLNTFCRVDLKIDDDDDESSESINNLQNLKDNDNNNNDLNNTSEKQSINKVRFSENIVILKSIKHSSLFKLIDTKKTLIIKNNLCPIYNEIFVFNNILENQLDRLAFEFTILNCQTLTSPCAIGNCFISKLNSNLKLNTNLDKQISNDEIDAWKQITDKINFNKWINNLIIKLRPID